MIRFILCAMAVLLSCSAVGFDQGFANRAHATCTNVSLSSGVLMEYRQTGTSASDAIAAIRKARGGAEGPFDTVIVGKAYAVPRYDTLEGRMRAVDSFTDEIYLWCRQKVAGDGGS